MMCHSTGLPPISIIGLGFTDVSSLMRVPNPPASITAFTGCSPVRSCLAAVRLEANILEQRHDRSAVVSRQAPGFREPQVHAMLSLECDYRDRNNSPTRSWALATGLPGPLM